MDQMRPLVSVIIPTYNGSRFIRETIDSALAQDAESMEIIVGDDASTDDTRDVLRSYGDRIRTLFPVANQGNGWMRNALIEASRGRYIACLDHDDLFLPGKIATQIQAMEAHPSASLCHTGVELFGDDQGDGPIVHEVRATAHGACFPAMVRRCGIVISSVLMRRSMMPVDGFWNDLAGVRDYGLFMRMLVKHEAIYLPQVLTRYRRHAHQITHAGARSLQVNAGLARLRVLKEFENDLDAALLDDLRNWTIDELSQCASSHYWRGEYISASVAFHELVKQGVHVPWRRRIRSALMMRWNKAS